MKIKRIALRNFRNYEDAVFSFDDGITVISGKNAVGKTNILEGIMLLSSSRSHRLASDNEMIRMEEQRAIVVGISESQRRENRLQVQLFRDRKKQISVNGVPAERSSELFGFLNCVIFCPEDLKLIKGSPKEKRRMMNIALCRLKKGYMNALYNYNKVLEQRNHLLKNQEKQMIWVWNQKLVEYGLKICDYRMRYINRLSDEVNRIMQEFSGEEAQILYKNGFGAQELTEQQLTEALERNEEKDLRMRITSAGAHRDSLQILINGKDSREYASQGQQRSLAVAIKLAETFITEEVTGEKPVLLLDDVLSELDSGRKQYILNHIQNTQVILTTTDAEEISFAGQQIRIG